MSAIWILTMQSVKSALTISTNYARFIKLLKVIPHVGCELSFFTNSFIRLNWLPYYNNDHKFLRYLSDDLLRYASRSNLNRAVRKYRYRAGKRGGRLIVLGHQQHPLALLLAGLHKTEVRDPFGR